jgi:hypothetical protein
MTLPTDSDLPLDAIESPKIRKRIREISDAHSMGPRIIVEPSDEVKRKRLDAQKAAVEKRLKERG